MGAGDVELERYAQRIRSSPGKNLELARRPTSRGAVPHAAATNGSALSVGESFDFGSVSAEPYLLSGWSGGEGAFRWTDGRAAELVFGLHTVEPLLLEMQVEAFLPPRRVREQPVKIDVNGAALETVRLNQPGTTTIAVRLPAAALKRENQLRLELPKSAFAAPFGLGSDSRQLGIAVHWLRLRREE